MDLNYSVINKIKNYLITRKKENRGWYSIAPYSKKSLLIRFLDSLKPYEILDETKVKQILTTYEIRESYNTYNCDNPQEIIEFDLYYSAGNELEYEDESEYIGINIHLGGDIRGNYSEIILLEMDEITFREYLTNIYEFHFENATYYVSVNGTTNELCFNNIIINDDFNINLNESERLSIVFSPLDFINRCDDYEQYSIGLYYDSNGNLESFFYNKSTKDIQDCDILSYDCNDINRDFILTVLNNDLFMLVDGFENTYYACDKFLSYVYYIVDSEIKSEPFNSSNIDQNIKDQLESIYIKHFDKRESLF